MWVWIGVNVLSPSQTLTFAFLNWGYIIAGVRLIKAGKMTATDTSTGRLSPCQINRCSQAYVLTDNSAACRPRGKVAPNCIKNEPSWSSQSGYTCRRHYMNFKHVLGAIQYFPFMLVKVHGWYPSVVQISSTDYLEEPNIKGTVRWLEPCPFARWRVI